MAKKDIVHKNNAESVSVEAKQWQSEEFFYATTEFESIYTNSARIKFNSWDATLLFGEIAGEKDDKLVIVPKVRITMSLQFAKALQELLNKNIGAFEDKFGEIQEIEITD